jgi:hypothetical protein
VNKKMAGLPEGGAGWLKAAEKEKLSGNGYP